METQAEFLTTKEAAAFLGLKPNTLNTWRCRGGGPPFRKISHRTVRYSIRDLRAWIDARIRVSTTEKRFAPA